ncbi:MAG: hypothetical protein OXG52_05200 [bacterium]|nr:hypothetical protein [bacterium]
MKDCFECDLLYETPAGLASIEIKSGRTTASDWFSAPRRLAGMLPQVTAQAVVHGGAERRARATAAAVPLGEFAGFLSDLDTPQAPPDDTSPEPTQPPRGGLTERRGGPGRRPDPPTAHNPLSAGA